MMCETSNRLTFGSRGLKYLEIVIRLINGAFYYKRISVVIMNNYAARDVENRSGHRNALLYCTMDSLQFWFNFLQVEYAMEAIGHAGTCLGMLSEDGILLAAERRNTNKLLDEAFHSEKIYHLNENMACSVAGITSDANVLVNNYS